MSVKAIRIPYAGGYNVLQHVELAEPTFGANIPIKDRADGKGVPLSPDHVLIATKAIGVNYADVCIRWGLYESAKQYVGWPITPGFEVSGTVLQVGSNVTKVKPGDRVIACTLFGGYSSHVVVPQIQCFPIPDNMTFDQAAAFPAAALTAWYAIYEMCSHLKPGNHVLVHSAGGGVGLMLCQLLREAGCFVVGVVGSTHKVDLCKGIGCHEVIDKSKESLWQRTKQISPKGYLAVFDANGAETLRQSFDSLAPEGRLVCYGFHTMLPKQGGVLNLWNYMKMAIAYFRTPRFNPLEMTSTNRSVMCFNLSFLFDRLDLLDRALGYLVGLVKQNKLVIHVGASFPLQEVARAHAHIESGKSTGKIVLIPN